MKLVLLAILLSAVFAAHNPNNACTLAQLETNKSHYTVKFDGFDNCIDKRAYENMPILFQKIDDEPTATVSNDVVTVDLSLDEPGTCNGGSSDCFPSELYDMSVTNKNGDEVLSVGSTVTNASFTIDDTKAKDSVVWCGTENNATGDVDCDFDITYKLTGINGGEIKKKQITVQIKRVPSNDIQGETPDFTITHASIAAASLSNTENITYTPVIVVERHDSNSYDNTITTGDIQLGEKLYLRLKVQEKSVQAFDAANAIIELENETGDNINISEDCVKKNTATVPAGDNFLDLDCPINYPGTYSVKINGNRVARRL